MKRNNFIQFSFTAFVILGFKILLQDFFEQRHLNAYFSYAIVHIVVLFVSYSLHVRYTFKNTLNRSNFYHYIKMVIGFKAVDYALFSGAFAFFDVSSRFSILMATVVLFLLRYTALNKKFSQ